MWDQIKHEESSGGGFLNDSVSGTQASGSAKKNNDRSIVPLMVKQITSALGDLQIGGKTVNTLTILGVVRNIEKETTKISYQIEDDTGTISAMMWLEANKEPEDNIKINTYARIYGLIREQNHQRHILILRIFPIEDLNDLTCHFLEVMHFMLLSNVPVDQFAAMSNDNANTLMCDNTVSGMTPNQVMVLEIVRSANKSECGIQKRDILTKLPNHIISCLPEILEFLACEGHIYTTSSEDCFKAT